MLRRRLPHAVEGQVPTAAGGEALPDVEVRRGAELEGIVGRHAVAAVAEARSRVNRVRPGVADSEVGLAEEARAGDGLLKAQLHAVVVGRADVAELVKEAEGRVVVA